MKVYRAKVCVERYCEVVCGQQCLSELCLFVSRNAHIIKRQRSRFEHVSLCPIVGVLVIVSEQLNKID